MDKNSKYNETRRKLIEFSNIAKKLQEVDYPEMTINEILLQKVYDRKGATEFNTFNQWKKKGYTVLKGEKSYLIWGQPINKQKAEEKGEEYSEAEDDYKYFPVCYLFSDKQVYKKEEQTQPNNEENKKEEPVIEYLPL